MRKLVTALCALVFLSSCDDELKLVSRDFSVTLKSIDVGTAVVGKPVNCTLTISDLDPDNGDQILTRFEVRDGDGVILVDNNEYSPEKRLNMISRQTIGWISILSRQPRERRISSWG